MIRLTTDMYVSTGMVDTIYFHDPSLDASRWLVSLVVAHGSSETGDVASPEQAVAASIAFAQQEDAMWYVFDRKTGDGRFVAAVDVRDLVKELM